MVGSFRAAALGWFKNVFGMVYWWFGVGLRLATMLQNFVVSLGLE